MGLAGCAWRHQAGQLGIRHGTDRSWVALPYGYRLDRGPISSMCRIVANARHQPPLEAVGCTPVLEGAPHWNAKSLRSC